MKKSRPLPIELLKYFRYYYSKENLLFFEPKSKKKPSFEKGETYWVPEEYRIVDDLIQYKADIYKSKTPAWIEPTKMKVDHSRYHIEIVDVSESKIQNLDKKQALKAGIAPKNLTWYFSEEKPKEFKKTEEVWRLKQYWDNLYPDTPWENNPDILLFEFKLHKIKTEMGNYLDKHWFEKVKLSPT